MTNAFQIVRQVVLGVVLLLSFAVLGLCAHVNALKDEGYYYYSYLYDSLAWTENESLGIAAAVLTVLSIIVLLVVDHLRTGAFTSMIIVELVWLSILWVMWLATAGINASWCATGLCSVFAKAAEALSFLIWIVLLGYTITLLTCAIIGSQKGQKTWTSSVKETKFFVSAAGPGVVAPGMPVQQGLQPSPMYPPHSVSQAYVPSHLHTTASHPFSSLPQV